MDRNEIREYLRIQSLLALAPGGFSACAMRQERFSMQGFGTLHADFSEVKVSEQGRFEQIPVFRYEQN